MIPNNHFSMKVSSGASQMTMERILISMDGTTQRIITGLTLTFYIS